MRNSRNLVTTYHILEALIYDTVAFIQQYKKEGNVLFNVTLNTFYLLLYGRKEGNVLFNDALNTIYLRLYGK